MKVLKDKERGCCLWCVLLLLCLLSACRGDDIIIGPETEEMGDTIVSQVLGLYLLNEGNMGSNKSTLDYYDFTRARYIRNIYSAANPGMAQSLGDVGNDLAIYGSRLYAVLNCSNMVEVMDVSTATHIGQVNVPNCRYLCFAGAFVYLTSYAGPVQLGGHSQIGYVAKIDTATLQIVDTCHVGFQPDGLAVYDGKLYVANSGGYLVPNYETTVDVIDLFSFRKIASIDVAPNLDKLCVDTYGQLWVSSRGDYFDRESRLYCVDIRSNRVIDTLDIPVGDMWLDGDSLYVCASAFSYQTMQQESVCGIVDVSLRQIVTRQLVSDGTQIEVPYGIAVHPKTKDIYITDAGNYVTPGVLYCFAPDGAQRWSVRTGDIPAHFAFREQSLIQSK